MSAFRSYRTLARLLVAALPALAFQCGCDECAVPCAAEPVGRLRLPALSRAWLPASPPDSVRFVNSNGFRATLRRVPPLTTDSVPLSARFGDVNLTRLEYPQTTGCGRFFWAERQRLRYQGRNLNLTLTYDLTRDASGDYPFYRLASPNLELTQAVADTLPDAVLVNFNEAVLATFPVVRRPYRTVFSTSFSGSVRYLDSVRVAGQLVRGVYQYQRPATNTNAIELRSLYFVPGQGIVGFTYTNDEQWVRF
ncbi:hypothetical protein [Hymenobacter cellulosilyticus]|uniref:Uncharacterized protein n=1 Tax=Hymenobacter cellulosilyticus TaxID=2932248 RepID=A0A8T9QA42_9BACT|nr:hypothetical protein [Hymenobacter cellulosilyticus]UOQ74387.1 hypothetical protein MUN79_11185 [Hymenobacter cellulosilyticus]